MAGRVGLGRRSASLAGALFLYGFGEELWIRYIPEYLRVLGASAFLVGVFGALKDLLDAAYAFPGGVLSDRLGTRRALLLFGSITAAGIALLLLWRSVAGAFVAIFLVAAWASLGLPATFAVVGEELSGAGRVVGFTVQAVVKRIPIVLGPPIGGWLIERFGIRGGLRAGLAVSLGLTVVMLLGLRRWLGDGRAGSRESRLPPGTARRPERAIHLPATLRRLLIADCLVRLCEGLPDVFMVVWAIEIVRVTPAQFGLLVSILTGTAIASYLPAAALAGRENRKPFVVMTFFFFALFPLCVSAARSFAGLAAAYAVGGLREIGEPSRKALIVDLADGPSRGRIIGLYYAIRGFTVAGAAAVGGALWMVRPSLTFQAAAGLGALGTAFAALFLRKGEAA
jgi:MFS family permease